MHKYETQAYIFSCSSYGAFPVPLNETQHGKRIPQSYYSGSI
jgi:hypothetical protein